MRRAALLTVLAVLALVVLVPAVASAVPAPPYDKAACLECHDTAYDGPTFSKVSFAGIPAVDKTKCNACHWIGLHPDHYRTSECTGCHVNWPSTGRATYYSTYVSPLGYGIFNSSTSTDADAATLHAIHGNGSWPAQVQPKYGVCASCHAPAACDACHGTEHASHGSGELSPQLGTVGAGAPAGSLNARGADLADGTIGPDLSYTTAEYCTNPACHFFGERSTTYSRHEQDDPSVVYGGTAWSTVGDVDSSGGSFAVSNVVGNTVTFTFSGTGVSWIGKREATGGVIEVYLDGVLKTTVNLYTNFGDLAQQTIYKASGLPQDTHTLVLKTIPNPTKGRSTYLRLSVDAFDVLPGAAPAGVIRPECLTCHSDRTNAHGYDTVDHVGDVGEDVDGGGKTCASCHAMDVLTEHERATSASAGGQCGTCHGTPRDTFAAWDQTCQQGGCHAEDGPTEPHASIEASHAPAAAGAVCAECHPGDLAGVHADKSNDAGDTSCNLCHSTSAFPATNDCTACHFTFDGHYDETKHLSSATLDGCDGEGCHTTRDLMGVHAEKNAAFTCFGCHSSTRAEVVDSIANDKTGCGDCHGDVGGATAHYSAHPVDPPLINPDGSGNYMYGVGSTGTVPTSDCGMCHQENLLDEHLGAGARPARKDFNGVSLTCASCHDSAADPVKDAITAGGAACEDCHGVHEQIPQVHSSSFTGTPGEGCSLCHSSDLTIVHDGTMTTTLPSGRVLAGCEICHENYEGDRGITVQTAIELTNDTRCTSCHPLFHDPNTHYATAPESSACGPCHKDGTDDGQFDVKVVHEGLGCAICHDNPDRVPELTSVECATCHTTQGTDYHRNMAVHYAPDSYETCGHCHHGWGSSPIQGPDVTRHDAGCLTCHENPDVNLEGITTACVNCHDEEGVNYHYETVARHTPTDAESADCARCHKAEDGTADVREVHVTDGCATCHADYTCGECHTPHNAMEGALLVGTACKACHAVLGTDYHSQMDAGHAASTDMTGCISSGCHQSSSLPAEHERFLNTSEKTTYEDTCAMCHLNTTEGRIDWASATSDCYSCHDGHGDLTVLHTSTASAGCVRCHGSADVRDIHGATQAESCATCHNDTSSVAGKTAECSSCHTTEGTDYHRSMNLLHAGMTPSGGCTGAGCHPSSGSLPDAHAKLVGPGKQFDAYADTCALCHLNSDGTRIDWTVVTATCGDCHGVPHDRMQHSYAAPESQECLGCHEAPGSAGASFVPGIHGADGTAGGDWARCATCHENPEKGDLAWNKTTSDCAGCHDYYPADPTHYPTASHEATNGALNPGVSCSNCHSMDMKTEHFKPTATTSTGYAITCVLCHEVKVDAFTAPWDKTCEACHATKHGDQNASHDFSTTNPSCGTGAGCHDTSNVVTIHNGTPGGPCGSCHNAAAIPPKDCTASGCHANMGSDHHAAHDTTGRIDGGCKGCHYTHVDDEHAKLGYTCDTCHASANQAVKDAIDARDVSCPACHPEVNGKDRHAAQKLEFTSGNSSGHRAYDTLPGMRSSFVVNGNTYSWTLPSASSFLKTGWTASSVVTCDGCHTFSSTAAGPHGSSVTVNIDPAYPGSYKSAYLNDSGISPSNTICAKCHTNFTGMNEVHGDHHHQDSSDGKCINCHSQIPHGWRLPRLLAYATDPLPYRTASGGITKISLHSHSPSNWDEGDCQAGCDDDHDRAPSPYWPSTLNAVGSLQGLVLDEGGLPVVGATVLTDKGQTWTTNFEGVYVFNDIAGGTYNITVSKTGYFTQTKPGVVTNDSVTDVDFTLVLTPPPGTVTGSVTGPDGTALEGATVAVAGGGSTTSASDGSYSLTLEAGTYTVTASAKGYVAQAKTVVVTSGGATATDFSLAAGAYDIAMGKSISASTEYSSSYPAENANDGLADTYWRSSSAYSQTLKVDLGGYYDLEKIVVDWNTSYYARGYRIEVSQDNAHWTQVYSTSYAGTYGTKTHLTTETARYVRLTCTASSSSGYRVNAFEVWGQAAMTGTVSGYVRTSAGTAIAGATVSSGSGGHTATTDADGSYSIGDVLPGTYTLTASATGYDTASTSVAVAGDVNVTADFSLLKAAVNVALNKVATASSTYYRNIADNAVDGATSTYWRSARDGTQYLTVDLGAICSVDEVVINWYSSYYARAYKVQVANSNDGDTVWTDVYTTTSGSSGTKTHGFAAIDARYVRLYCTNTYAGSYRVNEFEVWAH